MEIEVLYSRDDILAINKPPGMCSQGPKTGPVPEVWELARMHHPDASIVHRIDMYTTGVNLVGLSRKVRGYMMANWHQITRKVYLAIIRSPEWHTRTVRKKLSGKTAITAFRVLERSGEFALVRCELVKNGRKHQIRRHLRSIGSPIVGDRRYKGPETSARAGQLLHAWRMEFRRPNQKSKKSSLKPGGWVKVKAPIPADFRKFTFNWDHWDKGASAPEEIWQVTAGWKRRKTTSKIRQKHKSPKQVDGFTWAKVHELMPEVEGKLRKKAIAIEHRLHNTHNRLAELRELFATAGIISIA